MSPLRQAGRRGRTRGRTRRRGSAGGDPPVFVCGGKEEVGQGLRIRNVVSLALWVEAVFDSKQAGEERDELSSSLSNQSSNGTKHGVVAPRLAYLILRASVLRRGAAFFRQSFGAWNMDKDVPILCKREGLRVALNCAGPERRWRVISICLWRWRAAKAGGTKRKGKALDSHHDKNIPPRFYHKDSWAWHQCALLVQAALLVHWSS